MKSATPKVLHSVCGRPMIQYVVDLVRTLGSLKTYVVLGHRYDAVHKALDKGLIAVRQKRLLGTGDAIMSAAAHFKNHRGEVIVVCGDTPLLKKATVQNLIRKHRSAQAAGSVLTAVVDCPQGYGRIIRDGHGDIVAIREDKDVTPSEKEINEINVGVYCFDSRALFKTIASLRINRKKKEFYLTDIVELFRQKGWVFKTAQTDDAVEGLGINNREDLAFAEGVLRRRILKDLMAEGLTIVDPKTTYVDAGVVIGRDTIIRPFTVIENNVRIGRRCLIGPFCRLRPGTKIEDEAEIGNFTEVSRTQFGNGSLMKHFSFLGDAVVGSKVNIGAGTVTANYDGKNKNRTHIGNEAFIGSDSILVAPVKIGKRAMTGAGSVVTKGKVVPEGKIAVGVPARILGRKH